MWGLHPRVPMCLWNDGVEGGKPMQPALMSTPRGVEMAAETESRVRSASSVVVVDVNSHLTQSLYLRLQNISARALTASNQQTVPDLDIDVGAGCVYWCL
jgi:hypothetical protein